MQRGSVAVAIVSSLTLYLSKINIIELSYDFCLKNRMPSLAIGGQYEYVLY